MIQIALRVFLAAPLFSAAERMFNVDVARKLREAGFDVWLAQETPFVAVGNQEEKKGIFDADLEALRNSDVVLAVLDGVDVDSGVAFELGYAHAIGKRTFGLKTDHRVFSRVEQVNLMVEVPLERVFSSVEDFLQALMESR